MFEWHGKSPETEWKDNSKNAQPEEARRWKAKGSGIYHLTHLFLRFCMFEWHGNRPEQMGRQQQTAQPGEATEWGQKEVVYTT